MEFSLELTDRLTGPASRMQAGLSGVRSGMRSADASADRFAASVRGAGSAAGRGTRDVRRLADAGGDISTAFGKADKRADALGHELRDLAKDAGKAGKGLSDADRSAEKFSKSAKQMQAGQKGQGALGSLLTGAKGSGGFQQMLSQGGKMQGMFSQLGGAASQFGGQVSGLSSRLGAGGMGGAGGHYLKFVKQVIKYYAIASAAAAAFAAKLIHSGYKAAEYQRSTSARFAAFSGGRSDGSAETAAIRDIQSATASNDLGLIRDTFSTLTSAGIGTKLATDLSKLRLDMAAMGEEAESAFGKFSDAMVEGEVTASQFEDLAKTLGGKRAFGKALGLSDAALENSQRGVELLDAELKKLDPEAFLQRAVDHAREFRGELGAVAKAGQSAFGRGQAAWQGMLLETTEGTDMGGGALADMFERLAGGEAGKRFKGFMRGLFEGVEKTVKAAIPAIEAFFDGLTGGLLKSEDGGSSFESFLATLSDPATIDAFREFGEYAGRVISRLLNDLPVLADYGLRAFGILGSAMDAVNSTMDSVSTTIDSVTDSLEAASTAVGDFAESIGLLPPRLLDGIRLPGGGDAAPILPAAGADGLQASILRGVGRAEKSVSVVVNATGVDSESIAAMIAAKVREAAADDGEDAV